VSTFSPTTSRQPQMKKKRIVKLTVYVAREDSLLSSFNLRGREVIQLHIGVPVLSLAFPILIIDQLRHVRRTLDGVLEKTCDSRSLSGRLMMLRSHMRHTSTAGDSTAPAYAGMPTMTPTSARSAVTLPVSMTSPPLATISTKRGAWWQQVQ
jgi:hypothetical protein